MENRTEPLVSVIVPVYKVEKYLDRCIKSIRNQTYKNLEIILVDDGSPDNCGAMCDEYKANDARIEVVHKANGGLSSARNAGIAVAKGDFLCFVDSDDWITEDMVDHMVALQAQHEADIVSVSYVLTSNENQKMSPDYEVNVMHGAEALEYYLRIGMSSRVSDYPVWIKLYKKDLFKDTEFPKGVLYEDYTTNVELLLKCQTYVKSTKCCYFYYQGGTSIVRSGYKRRDHQLITQCEKVCQAVAEQNAEIIGLANDKLSRSYFSLLLKIVCYGFDSEMAKEEQKNIIKEYVLELRKRKKALLHSSMPFNRKLLMVVLCFNYRLLLPFGVLNKWLNR